MIPGRLLLLLALAWTALAGPARAHTKSETVSVWQVSGATLHMTFTAPEIEVKRLAASGAAVDDARFIDHVGRHVAATAAGQPCAAAHAPRMLSAAPGYRRVELVLACPSAKDIVLHLDTFMNLVPTHVNFAQIQTGDGDLVEQVFKRDHTEVPLGGPGGSELQNASFLEYIRLGVMHIFTGIDHQCFLLGMVLICRRLRDLLFVVTGFTLGHSATLALAVTGVIRPHAEYIDALIALTIVLIGVENVAVATRKPAVLAIGLAALLGIMAVFKTLGFGGLPILLSAGGALFAANYLMISGALRDAGRLRLLVTLIFGLIHGFGFASDLLEMKLPAGRLAELLVGFNLGVEIGQMTLVLGVTAAALALSRLRLAPPRAAVVDVGSAFLVAIGLYWFVSRAFSLPATGLGG